MDKKIVSDDQRKQLVKLQAGVDEIRKALGIGAPGEILSHYYDGSDTLIAEADGFGGAWLRKVSDDYPFDYRIECSLKFDTEEDAMQTLDYYNYIKQDTMAFEEFLDAVQHKVIIVPEEFEIP